MAQSPITVVGAGIVGLWQTLTLAQRGHKVRLVERSAEPFADAASLYAGAMLAPYCEAEIAEPIVRELGLASMALWRETYPGLAGNGTLVVAQPRDRGELQRFARLTEGHERADAARIEMLEPDIGGRFTSGLFYAGEAHLEPAAAMAFILKQARDAGAEIAFGQAWQGDGADGGLVVDCRGLAAQNALPDLRGVRGERLVVRTREIELRRPVRLLHPRFPLYVVPWGEGLHMVGATQIESAEEGPVSVRSALELLGTAYALHPAFGEAEIVAFAAAARPAFPDNCPRIIVRRPNIYVNGVFRHGFLLAPALAQLVAEHIETGDSSSEVFKCALS